MSAPAGSPSVRVVLADLSDTKAAADWMACTQAYACSDTALGRPLSAETLQRSVVGLSTWPTGACLRAPLPGFLDLRF